MDFNGHSHSGAYSGISLGGGEGLSNKLPFGPKTPLKTIDFNVLRGGDEYQLPPPSEYATVEPVLF